METQRVQMKEVLPWLVCWACHAGARDFCSDLAALFGPVQICFPHHTLFKFLSPYIVQQADRLAVLGRLSFSM